MKTIVDMICEDKNVNEDFKKTIKPSEIDNLEDTDDEEDCKMSPECDCDDCQRENVKMD